MAPTSTADFSALHGHCTCKAVTYTLTAPPLVTHCCHCTYCQRESGSAFAINIMIEVYNVKITSSISPIVTGIPSLSSPAGDSHLVAQCPKCITTVYAHYSGNKALMFVKAGTLDDESRNKTKPDAHIFTDTKVAWVDLKSEEERGAKVCEKYYKREDVWSGESLKRREVLLKWIEEQRENESLKEKEGGEASVEALAQDVERKVHIDK